MASFVEVGGHAGDEGNFEALYETYKHDVQRLASYLLKNASDAEDAAQTVFMNVLRALRQGVTPADPRAWLLAITRNVCFSRGRAAAARPDWVELDYDAPAQQSDDRTPSAEEIVGALARMRANQRTALILRDFRGVSRSEIADLMSLSAVSVEALLTRARAAFREELEAGDQPFVCEETRKLVQQQLDGKITVADRHSLRTHLRHCSPCSTLARAVRSSRGKLAGLVFWPVDLVSRLASALSQAPAVAHVAAAVSSTAAVAAVTIPVAMTNGPATTAHVEGRTAPAPAMVTAAPQRPTVAPRASAPASTAARVVTRTFTSHATVAHKASHKTSRTRTHAATKPASKPATAARPKIATAPASTSSASSAAPQAATASAIHTPDTVQPVVVQATPPRAVQPVTTPRSVSPATRPASKPRPPAKPKPARKSSKRPRHHAPAPPGRMPPSSPPAASLPPAEGGASGGAGPGFTAGPGASPAVVPVAPASSSQGGSGDTGDNGNGGSNGNSGGNGHGKHHK